LSSGSNTPRLVDDSVRGSKTKTKKQFFFSIHEGEIMFFTNQYQGMQRVINHPTIAGWWYTYSWDDDIPKMMGKS